MTDRVTATELRLRQDLVTRLRNHAYGGMHPVCDEAADVLECAEAAFKSLIAAIEREGYEVLQDGSTYSVRPRED